MIHQHIFSLTLKKGEEKLDSELGELNFEVIKSEDEGNYICSIQNATANIHINVMEGKYLFR